MKTKKVFQRAIILMVAFSLTTVTGCKKDDDDTSKKNGVTYKGDFYELPKGELDYYGNYGGNPNYNFDVSLYHETVSGGHGLYIWFWSSSSEDLVAGTYTFSSSGDANTFQEAEFGFETNSDYRWFECTSGTVKVSKSGEEYVFTINLSGLDEEQNSTTLKGYYKGFLTYYDETDSKGLKRRLSK